MVSYKTILENKVASNIKSNINTQLILSSKFQFPNKIQFNLFQIQNVIDLLFNYHPLNHENSTINSPYRIPITFATKLSQFQSISVGY